MTVTRTLGGRERTMGQGDQRKGWTNSARNAQAWLWCYGGPGHQQSQSNSSSWQRPSGPSILCLPCLPGSSGQPVRLWGLQEGGRGDQERVQGPLEDAATVWLDMAPPSGFAPSIPFLWSFSLDSWSHGPLNVWPGGVTPPPNSRCCKQKLKAVFVLPASQGCSAQCGRSLVLCKLSITKQIKSSRFSSFSTFVLLHKMKKDPCQFSSVAQSCPTLCDPMDCSTLTPCPSPAPGAC